MKSLCKWISIVVSVAIGLMMVLPVHAYAKNSVTSSNTYEKPYLHLQEEVSLFGDTEEENTDEDAYDIQVDGVNGTRFSSDEEAGGETWHYDPEKQWLTLRDYHGEDISANGDLIIFSYGETVISGDEWYGISSSGSVWLYCVSGSVTVTGDAPGFDAVRAEQSVYCSPVADTTITLIGGTCDEEERYGGNAIYASTVFLTMEGQVNAIGGKGADPSEFGGYAIFADRVYAYADCTLKAGDGAKVSEAVYTKEVCVIGRVNATITASGAGHSAFAGPGTVKRKYANYTHTEDYSEWVFEPYEYTIAFHGAGGTLNGQNSVVIEAPFDIRCEPEEVALADYVFTRPGYRQSGWMTNDGSTVELNWFAQPNFSTVEPDSIDLTAVWECVGPEVVLDESNIVAVIPNDWCAENRVSTVVLALYDQDDKMLAAESCDWVDGQDLQLHLTMDRETATSYSLFLLNDDSEPIQDAITAPIG